MNIGLENETVEFKKSTSELKEGLESIASILNKNRYGTLYFGVKNNGEVIGQEIGQETKRDISSAIRNHIAPECEFDVQSITTTDGKQYVVINFSGDRTPYSAYGRFFIRHSDEDHLMEPNEIEQYFKNKIINYSEWENSDSNCKLDDVDETLLRRKIEMGYLVNRIPYKYENPSFVLGKLGLLSRDKQSLNNAGEVLFSKNKPVLLKLATFATETKDTFIKLDHFQGNIYECIEKGINYILGVINWNIIFDGTPERKEIPEIPVNALREIVINAFGHGKYNSNTSFEIDVYKDRVTIYSPGFFPSGYIPEDFANKHEEPVILNPKITSVLFKTNEIESFGYGFATTFNSCKKNRIKYTYGNTKSGFKFTFYRHHKRKKSYNILSGIDKDVLDIIKRNNNVKALDIAITLSISDKTIYRTLDKLKKYGYIVREGNKRAGKWKVIKND